MPAHPDSRKNVGKLALNFDIKIGFLLDFTDKSAIQLLSEFKCAAGEVPYATKLDIVRIFAFTLSKKIFAFVVYDSYDDRYDFLHGDW